MRRMFLIVCVMFVWAAVSSPAKAQEKAPAVLPKRPFEEIRRVVIISVDGMRPDLMLRADTPRMHKLFQNGSFSFWARTTEVSITLPSHVSMLTGVPPEKHGITWNGEEHNDANPKYVNILDLAHKAGYRTALVCGKSKFVVLANRGGIDYPAIPRAGTGANDSKVGELAAGIIRSHKPDVMMIHFPDNDRAGHTIGWGTPDQQKVLVNADKAIGLVLDAITDAGIANETMVILTADHGGTGTWHGADDPRARHIPWIVCGPKIRKGLDLTTDRDLVIRIEDTFATAAFVLSLTIDVPVDGKPVQRIFERDELITPASTQAVSTGK